MTKEKIITKVVLLVSFVSLFTDIASEMLYPVMPVFLKSIGFSVLLIGILEGLAEAVAGLSKGYFGQLSDRQQKRVPFIRWGYTLSAFSKPMMALFIFPVWIFFARTLDRLGKGIRTSARDAMLSDESRPENKGKVFGFHRGMDTLGAAIGPLVALVFLAAYPGEYRWLFILAFIPGIIAIGFTFLLNDKRTIVVRKEKRTGLLEYFKYWKTAPGAYKKLISGLLVFVLFNSSDAFLLLYLKEVLQSDQAMIGFYIFYNISYALLSYPLGHLADRIELKNMLLVGFSIFIVVYAAIGFSTDWWSFVIIFFLYAIYAAATEGTSKAMITNLVPKEETATALGFYNSLASICTLLASSLAGLIWYSISAQAMFVTSAAGVMISVGILVSLKK